MKGKCPFLQYRKFCTNIYMSKYNSDVSKPLCEYTDCKKCSYYKHSLTKLKELLRKPKNTKDD